MKRVLTRLGVVGAATVLACGLAVGMASAPALAAGCIGTNNTDVAVPDLGSADSPMVISGCPGAAAVTSRVEVHIVHPYQGDLVVSLVAPDGSAYVLQSRVGGSADNLDQTFTVNLSSEAAAGTWRLHVQDAASGDAGFINTWTLMLAAAATCSQTNATAYTIPDNGTVTSNVAITCTGPASTASTVAVNITHTYSGDLVISLVAPDGSVYILRNRSGGSADNVVQTFTINLSGEVRTGTWGLRVQDASPADVGRINSWTLSV
ncbi:proprotein convertase P-domain-containing protein [Hamadaea tsunoensis]|uniref:proprotein convertase P-domain-containing protein n=1 Tax=Hamadaea tsunoensis TaxID=53368 RepID=UPI0004147F98|nr:proprotein convertase P-domain-containing protein [Hamadaea tsunoensis]